ncbi:MAG: transposase [Pirellulales bacterium]|nr:transposase [Pirellulales bacterium]
MIELHRGLAPAAHFELWDKAYPSALDRGEQSDRARKCALAEMDASGASARKAKGIVEELCGSEVSSTQVSRCAAALDDKLTKWRDRLLGAFPFVIRERPQHLLNHTTPSCLGATGVLNDSKQPLRSTPNADDRAVWRKRGSRFPGTRVVA